MSDYSQLADVMPMSVEIVKMSARGRIILPVAIRRKLKLGKGERLLLVADKSAIELRPVRNLKQKRAPKRPAPAALPVGSIIQLARRLLPA